MHSKNVRPGKKNITLYLVGLIHMGTPVWNSDFNVLTRVPAVVFLQAKKWVFQGQ